MKRSLLALPLVALCAVMAVIAGLAVTIASPGVAEAQDNTGASLSLHVSEPSADQTFRTIAVALEPNLSGLAAFSATLSFDASAVNVSDCAVSEVGACNVADGEVKVSVFNLARLQANDQLLTVNFEPTNNAPATTTFTVAPVTAVTNQGAQVDPVTGDSIEVEIATPVFGSLTGSVINAESTEGLFALDVCVISDTTGVETCTTSTGLGTWRVDDLATGTYAVVVSDATNTYNGAVVSGFVRQDEVNVVETAALEFYTEPVAEDAETAIEDDTAADAVVGVPSLGIAITAPAEVVTRTAPIEVLYDASIAGRVTALQADTVIVAAQVCATQPLVLHQSCATTDANGVFALSGLSAGNYWVEVVDPLGQFEQTRPRLVGVVGDDVARAGVNITLASVAE